MITTYIPNVTRHQLIDIVCAAYFRTCPGEARAMARYLREITSQEIRGGKWRDGNGMVSIRFPQNLFLSARAAFARAGLFPNFGDDSADIEYVVRTYPDIFKRRKMKRT